SAPATTLSRPTSLHGACSGKCCPYINSQRSCWARTCRGVILAEPASEHGPWPALLGSTGTIESWRVPHTLACEAVWLCAVPRRYRLQVRRRKRGGCVWDDA